MALWDFQKLEAVKILPNAKVSSPVYSVELRDEAGKPLFHLDEIDSRGKSNLKVVTRAGDKILTALTSQGPFQQWQDEMGRLVAGAEKPAAAAKKGATPKAKQ